MCTLVARRGRRHRRLVVVFGHLHVVASCTPPPEAEPHRDGQEGDASEDTNHYAGDRPARNAAAAAAAAAWLPCSGVDSALIATTLMHLAA
jgi:hypothetical protein